MAKAKKSDSPVKPVEAQMFKVLRNVDVPPAKLHIPEGQLTGRSRPVSDEEVVDLADSMNIAVGGVGQQQAIQVREIPGKPDEFQIVFGITRKRAADCIVNGYPANTGARRNPQPDFTLRCEVVDVDDLTAFKQNLVENVKRNKTSHLDDALNQQMLRDEFKMSDAEITRLYGYGHQASVTRLKKLLDLPDFVQDRVHNETCTLQAAFELHEILTDEKLINLGVGGPAIMQEVWDKVKPSENEKDSQRLGDTSISVQNVRDAYKAVKEAHKSAATPTTPTSSADGTPVESTPGEPGGVVAPTGTAPVNNGATVEEKGKELTLKQVKTLLEGIRDDERGPAKGREFASTFLHVIAGQDKKRLGLWMIANLSTDEEYAAYKSHKASKEAEKNGQVETPAEIPAETVEVS